MNWEEEAKHINMYADYEIEISKDGVIDYIDNISSINGLDELFSNEKDIVIHLMNTGIWIKDQDVLDQFNIDEVSE